MDERWPPLPHEAWGETCTALHLWCQVLGKYRLAHAPWVNHSWHATLYVTPRGLTTGAVPDPAGAIALTLDLHDHLLIAERAGGGRETMPLGPTSVAAFLARTGEMVAALGGRFAIHGRPNEIPDAVPFADDHAQRPYDARAVERFHRALVSIEGVFQLFRTGFLGKVSPVHLFWGSFDLAVTRFSGRRAPAHPGGIPNLPDSVTREAYSHEVCSAGFWPGGNGMDAAFYAYAYPTPEGFARAAVVPDGATWNATLGEFVLPYEAVRGADDPHAALLAFLDSTYVAAARIGGWDRTALECARGVPRVPRAVPA
ncbi:DUF5996 family protein [Salinarimonas chemoclinalis]|uniref:DUF5996 family protein n=1 Tax=Salinarimonas chemoclinalis TaxID=3241599 RepID=UPI003556A3A9